MFFFFNDTATTEIYTLSLHDALPISPTTWGRTGRRRPLHPAGSGTTFAASWDVSVQDGRLPPIGCRRDRKSTRLNSSHANISYAVFCLKKKKHQPGEVITLYAVTTID